MEKYSIKARKRGKACDIDSIYNVYIKSHIVVEKELSGREL